MSTEPNRFAMLSGHLRGAVNRLSTFRGDDEMSRINNALVKPYRIRSHEDLDVIERAMMKVKFFSKLQLKYGQLIFKEVCKYVYYRRVLPNQAIIKINKEGNTFYIILRGTVAVNIYLPKMAQKPLHRKDSLVPMAQLEVDTSQYIESEVNILHAGDTFGELALIDEQAKTSANVIAREVTDLACLDKEHYLQILGALKQAELSDKMSFVRGIHFLDGWFDNDLKTLSFHFELIQYYYKQSIFKEGDPLDGCLYFLKKGEIILIKATKLICRLVPGEIFGEEIYMNISVRQFHAQATQEGTQIYRLQRSDLDRRMWQSDSRQQFKESVKLRWQWRMQRCQEQLKSTPKLEQIKKSPELPPKRDIINNIIIERQNVISDTCRNSHRRKKQTKSDFLYVSQTPEQVSKLPFNFVSQDSPLEEEESKTTLRVRRYNISSFDKQSSPKLQKISIFQKTRINTFQA